MTIRTKSAPLAPLAVLLFVFVALTSCGSDDDTLAADELLTTSAAAVEPTVLTPTTAPVAAEFEATAAPDTSAESSADDTATTESATTESATTESATTEPVTEAATFSIEVWADNWSAVYVNGVLVGEDSVPITTERSFNAETFTFEASYPFTVAIEAKDFKQTDSGIEYIGLNNQQMGDGGIIAQVTNLSSGEVVAVTNVEWSALVVHQAPLNTECERDADPDATCEYLILETPARWADPGFDDSAWQAATEWSEQAVSPKDGYNEIAWDPSAQLIWGTDLEVDNTILLRSTIAG